MIIPVCSVYKQLEPRSFESTQATPQEVLDSQRDHSFQLRRQTQDTFRALLELKYSCAQTGHRERAARQKAAAEAASEEKSSSSDASGVKKAASISEEVKRIQDEELALRVKAALRQTKYGRLGMPGRPISPVMLKKKDNVNKEENTEENEEENFYKNFNEDFDEDFQQNEEEPTFDQNQSPPNPAQIKDRSQAKIAISSKPGSQSLVKSKGNIEIGNNSKTGQESGDQKTAILFGFDQARNIVEKTKIAVRRNPQKDGEIPSPNHSPVSSPPVSPSKVDQYFNDLEKDADQTEIGSSPSVEEDYVLKDAPRDALKKWIGQKISADKVNGQVDQIQDGIAALSTKINET